jgi:hypothetical protein
LNSGSPKVSDKLPSALGESKFEITTAEQRQRKVKYAVCPSKIDHFDLDLPPTPKKPHRFQHPDGNRKDTGNIQHGSCLVAGTVFKYRPH